MRVVTERIDTARLRMNDKGSYLCAHVWVQVEVQVLGGAAEAMTQVRGSALQ